jgi:hypothetical protein
MRHFRHDQHDRWLIMGPIHLALPAAGWCGCGGRASCRRVRGWDATTLGRRSAVGRSGPADATDGTGVPGHVGHEEAGPVRPNHIPSRLA